MGNKTEKLLTKDLITIGILSAIFVIVYAIAAMTLHFNPITFLFMTSVAAVPAGVIFMLLLAKVPKSGVLTITGVVVGLVLLLLGHWWVLVAIEISGGILADVFFSMGTKKSFGRMAVAYAIYMLVFTVAAYAPVVMFADAYFEAMGGADSPKAAMFASITSYLTWPVIALVLATSVVGSLAGAFLGRKLLNKHFVRAGIV